MGLVKEEDIAAILEDYPCGSRVLQLQAAQAIVDLVAAREMDTIHEQMKGLKSASPSDIAALLHERRKTLKMEKVGRAAIVHEVRHAAGVLQDVLSRSPIPDEHQAAMASEALQRLWALAQAVFEAKEG